MSTPYSSYQPGPDYPPTPTPPAHSQPRRPRWPWLAGIAALIVVGGIAALAVVLTRAEDRTTPQGNGSAFSSSTPIADDVPEPITRVELMQRYAEIAPIDESATPETMDALASDTCDALSAGVTTDDIIAAGTDIYGPQSTEVAYLLVSYGCPEYLSDFK